jgi:acetyl esterase/lipase
MQNLKASGKDVGCLVLEYDLTPTGKYPRQLQQAVALVDHTIKKLGRSPGKIILMGDSAGGNMVLGVASHLLHPHPQIAPLILDGPLHSAIMVSPWCTFDTTSDSFKRNLKKDCVSPVGLSNWAASFLGSAPADPYNQPLTAPPGWWNLLPRHIEKLLVSSGSNEVFVEDIKKVAARLKEVMKNDVTEIVAAGESHDQPHLDGFLGFKGGSVSSQALTEFLITNL